VVVLGSLQKFRLDFTYTGNSRPDSEAPVAQSG
jgi:hypothetical protein